MKITPDDPRLTAYALDELDRAGREAVETELESSDECRREVEEISRAAAFISTELATEPLPEWTYAEQLAIEAKLKPDSGKAEPRQRFPIRVLLTGRSPIYRAIGFAAGAVVLLGIWLGLSPFFTGGGPGTTALAQTLKQIQNARFITWTWTVYTRNFSEDGQMTWLEPQTIHYAYKAPGLYRREWVNDEGQAGINIIDTINRRMLSLISNQKKAILQEVTWPAGEPEGPYASVMKFLKGDYLQFVETRQTPTGEVNIFRYAIKAKDNASGKPWSYDYWIDSKTKQLVELHIPGTDIFDPDKDPARNNPPGKFARGEGVGSVCSGFVFNAELDDSLFRLDPPADYAVQTIGRLYVTEKEMIDFLGLLADYNDHTFPEGNELAGVFNDRRHTKTMETPKEDRSATEQRFWETLGHYIEINLNDPIGEFIHHSTVESSFRYLGRGVRLGDKDRIVCWYKLKGAQTYRVVYGDLSVRDVPPEELPLPVEP